MYPSCPLTFIGRPGLRSRTILPEKKSFNAVNIQQIPRNTPRSSGQGQNSFGGTLPITTLLGNRGLSGLPVVYPKSGSIVNWNTWV